MFFEIVLAWIYSHLLEYVLHRHLVHDPKRKLFFKSHFGDHHKESRIFNMVDTKYISKLNILGDPELKGLMLLMILHFPLVYFSPTAYLVLFLSGITYVYIHYKSHQNISWSRTNLPWHYDHHMAPNQNANWGVRLPMFDILFGTRKVYKGTKKEIIKYQVLKSRQKNININM